MRFEQILEETLRDLGEAHLLREPDDGLGRKAVQDAAARLGLGVLDASSNDYLGLGASVVSRETFARSGSGASRLVHGTADEHVHLESELAGWVGAESSLLFSTAYAANLGLLSSLGLAGTTIISDSANHASLIDGARLSKAEVVVVPHLDLDAIASAARERRGARSCWVVTESYFSMDGDGPDLRSLRALCDAEDACLIVDEAHALGVFGPRGAGRCAEAGIRADILVGALGKAVGSQGGFIAGSRQLRRFLWNRARSFVFSTAPSPDQAELTRLNLRQVLSASELRTRLFSNVERFRKGLLSAGVTVAPGSFGPIVSVLVGENTRALRAAARLQTRGILAQAIRPPTVPKGSARLRVTVKATFSDEQIQRLANELGQACRES